MKKLLIAVFTIMMALTPIHNAHAIAGFSTGNAGLVLGGIAGPVAGMHLIARSASSSENGQMIAFFLGLPAMIILGVVLLDEESGQIKFDEVDADQASKLGLTANEIEVYNSEVYEVNILVEEVSASLVTESTLKDSVELWDEMKEFVSPETFKVMQTLVSDKI